MKAYYVKYQLNGYWEKPQGVQVIANNKAEAYDKAVNEVIPQKHKDEESKYYPYSAWVHSVTYNNGNVRYFNTCDGKAY